MRWFSLLFSIWLLSSPLFAAVSEYTLAEAINEAGRQRMLSQRIVKAYAQLGLQIDDSRSQTELRHALALFDSQLERLNSLHISPEYSAELVKVSAVFTQAKGIATGEVTPQQAKLLLMISGTLLSECNRVVALLERASKTRHSALINIAGRQRMLSQRLTAFYLLNSWGIRHPVMEPGVRNTRTEFEKGLATLKENPLDNLEIIEQLGRIEQDWSWFESALAAPLDNRFNLVVMDASERLLESLEYLVALYEQEALTR